MYLCAPCETTTTPTNRCIFHETGSLQPIRTPPSMPPSLPSSWTRWYDWVKNLDQSQNHYLELFLNTQSGCRQAVLYWFLTYPITGRAHVTPDHYRTGFSSEGSRLRKISSSPWRPSPCCLSIVHTVWRVLSCPSVDSIWAWSHVRGGRG